jgi:RimJ/RimL family protein N-acetyltransferase
MHVISLAPLAPEVHAEAVQQVYRATPGYWAMYNLAGSPAGQAQRDLDAAVDTPGRHMMGIVRHVQPAEDAPSSADEADEANTKPETMPETTPDTIAQADTGQAEADLELVGIVDFRLYWPAADVAYIGMIMVAEPFQREGIGSQAWGLLRPWLVETAKVKKVRLGIEQFNFAALHFFQALGFVLTGETHRIEVGSKWVRLLYMEFELAPDEAEAG